jgi:hypothetical protein
MSLHLLCIYDIHLVHIHAIGVPEGVTLLEFEGLNPEERLAVEEQEVQAPKGGAHDEELPECPDHQPSSFLKCKALEHSKPPMFCKIQFKYLMMFDALSYRS